MLLSIVGQWFCLPDLTTALPFNSGDHLTFSLMVLFDQSSPHPQVISTAKNPLMKHTMWSENNNNFPHIHTLVDISELLNSGEWWLKIYFHTSSKWIITGVCFNICLTYFLDWYECIYTGLFIHPESTIDKFWSTK